MQESALCTLNKTDTKDIQQECGLCTLNKINTEAFIYQIKHHS